MIQRNLIENPARNVLIFSNNIHIITRNKNKKK